MERFLRVTQENLAGAAAVHAASWQESHRSFCTTEFVALHTPQRQSEYLRKEMAAGKQIWALEAEESIVGLVSVHGSVIENLYVAPEKQNRGYGTKLLRLAMTMCEDMPTLWILDNNQGAKRLYERNGFMLTGNSKRLTDTLCEIEMRIPDMWRLHSLMERALLEENSLEALVFLINAGRELEFRYQDTMGFISCSGSEKTVSLWIEGTQQSFASMIELIDCAVIGGKTLRAMWNEIEIETLF